MLLINGRLMMKIAIDIGHAHGTGSCVNGLDEHAIATRVAEQLFAELTKLGHSVQVIDFPDASNASDLSHTIELANRVGFDVGLSLHCDCASHSATRGAHVCYYRRYHGQSFTDSASGKVLAKCIAAQLCPFMSGRANAIQARPDKSRQLSGLAILSQTYMPWVLIELGFLSNEQDARILKDSPHILARLIAKGIDNYLN